MKTVFFALPLTTLIFTLAMAHHGRINPTDNASLNMPNKVIAQSYVEPGTKAKHLTQDIPGVFINFKIPGYNLDTMHKTDKVLSKRFACHGKVIKRFPNGEVLELFTTDGIKGRHLPFTIDCSKYKK